MQRLLMVLALLLATAASATAAVQLEFEVATSSVRPDEPTAPATTETVTVLLGADWFHVSRTGYARLWDLTAPTVRLDDHDADEWSRSSLHADVSFRDAEFANRLYLTQVPRAEAVDQRQRCARVDGAAAR
ncbi:MAG: hypothetical protein GY898_12965 [Proteobacteria bacterium]|nr:hypothetical protein [Pseudomonadota bacterium]